MNKTIQKMASIAFVLILSVAIAATAFAGYSGGVDGSGYYPVGSQPTGGYNGANGANIAANMSYDLSPADAALAARYPGVGQALEAAKVSFGEYAAMGNGAGMDASHGQAEYIRSHASDIAYGYAMSQGGGYIPTPTSTTFSITVEPCEGGTISPSGTISVTSGESKEFTFTANTNYAIDTVTVDGSAVTLTENKYTLSNITANHTIKATFKKVSKFSMGFDDGTPVTDRNGNDLTARNATIKSGYGVFLHIPVGEMVNLAEAPKATMKATFFKDRNAEHELVFVSSDSGGYFELPANPESPTGAKCAYIPVGAKNKKYDITVTVTAKGVDSNNYSFTHTYTIEVKGSMYDDVQFS